MKRFFLILMIFIVPCLCLIASGQTPQSLPAATSGNLNDYSLIGIISLVIAGSFQLIRSLTHSLAEDLKTAIENNTEALYEIKEQLGNLNDRITKLENQ